MTTTAPLTPPTCQALAAAEGMTREAFRVRVEWHTLITFTRLMGEAAAVALDPNTGRLLADMGAYLQLVTPGIPLLGAFLYHGVYDILETVPGDISLETTEPEWALAYRWDVVLRKTPFES